MFFFESGLPGTVSTSPRKACVIDSLLTHIDSMCASMLLLWSFLPCFLLSFILFLRTVCVVAAPLLRNPCLFFWIWFFSFSQCPNRHIIITYSRLQAMADRLLLPRSVDSIFDLPGLFSVLARACACVRVRVYLYERGGRHIRGEIFSVYVRFW